MELRLDQRRTLQRTLQLDALCRSHGLDPDHDGRVVHHIAKSARRVSCHRYVILLIGRSRETVDTCRMGKRLVLGCECCGRNLRDHETGVEPSVTHQEWWQ